MSFRILFLLLLAAPAWAWTTRGFDDSKAPAYLELPMAGCQGTTATSAWDLPTTTPAVATCLSGTNIQQGTLDFADTSGGFAAQYTVALPVDWGTNRLPDVSLYWQTTTITGNVKWTIQFVCTAVNASATDDPAFPTSGAGFNTVTVAVPGTASRVQTSAVSGATLPTSCVTSTKMLLHIRIFRDGNDAADTATGATIRVKAMELIIYMQE